MAYSSVAQLYSNVKLIAASYAEPGRGTFALAAITTADQNVRVDIGNVVNTALIPVYGANPNTPEFVNLLSQYKSAEISLVRMSGAHRQVTEIGDIDYWKGMYTTLLATVLAGKIPFTLSNGNSIGTGVMTFSNDALPDVEPYFGNDKYGGWADKDDLIDIRETTTGGD